MLSPIEINFKLDKTIKRALTTELMIKSHDINVIEFHISFDGLELTADHTVKVLSVFNGTKSQTNVTCDITDGKAIYRPDTSIISQNEHVRNYVYVYHGDQSLDVREFIYRVSLSKIDETALKVKEVYDQSYVDLLTDFEQALEDYKLTLPQADSVRADIDEMLNQVTNQAVADWKQDADTLLETVEGNESARVDAETTRKTSETDRVSSETTRKTNETTRISNENARKSAESVRVANEEERISKDSERDSKIEEIERVATNPPKPIHTLKVENEVFSSDEVSVSEGVITINNHNLKAGDKVAFVATATSYNVTEPFDGAMRLNTVYYVVNVSSDSFQISTTQSGEPIVFNIDTKGFLWQFEKVSVNSLQVSGLDGTSYKAVFTGAHDGGSSRRLLNVYTNPSNIVSRYSSKDIRHTMTATDINPVHGVIDVYSEMLFKVVNRKILITVDSSFTTIDESRGNHSEETYRNRIVTRTNNPTVGFQDSISLIGIGSQHLFDGSTLEVYEV